jgi:uncharacterized membrane protein YdfJ with MMPL/SSD domain
MTAFYAALASLTYRRRWWFAAAWLLVLIVAAVGAARSEHAFQVGGYNLPGTEFSQASQILATDLQISSDKSALVVFHSDNLLVTDKPFHDAVQNALVNLQSKPYVVKADSFYSSGVPDMVSADNHTTYALVTLEGSENELEGAVPEMRKLVQSDVITVHLVGQAAANYDVETASAQDLTRVERFTLPVIFILLILLFGSIAAACVPVILGAACVLTSLALLYLLSLTTDISIFALNTASMIGLGLAIDFSLMLVSRYREELRHATPEAALERTLQTAGRSITFSGITLMLTMSVLTLFPVMIIRSIALALVIVAAVAVVAGLLLLPVILAILGPKVNSLSVQRWVHFRRDTGGESVWRRWAYRVMARPWTSIVIAVAILGLMALPALRMHVTGVTVEVIPKTTESRKGVDLLKKAFGNGQASPIFVVVQAQKVGGLWQPDLMQGVLDLDEHLNADPRVANIQSLATLVPNPTPEWIRSLSPTTLASNPDRLRLAKQLANIDGTNSTTVLVVYPKENETNKQTVQLMLDLRHDAKTWAPGLASANVVVGGSPAQHYDFDHVVYSQFPLLVGLSLLVTFVILMLFFHSLILPLKAILLNVISLIASYGILVLVFQFGWGDSLLGFTSLGALLSYTPVLLFSILFGLSTDYEVFLLTRVREYYRRGESNEDAVALGLEHTAGIITAAGLIMIVVFGSFALTQVLVIKEIGFGLAVAVLLDMTLVRIVLVPATMKLMGHWNWWLPSSLNRLIPEIDEGESAPEPVLGFTGGGE